MLLSSGVVWRHHSLEDFHAECPGGDARLQRRIVEELDDALDWLESLGAEPLTRETRQPAARSAAATTRARSRTCSSALPATCGWRSRSARRRSWPPAASAPGWPASAGCCCAPTPGARATGSTTGVARGAAVTAGMDEFYGRALPAQRGGGRVRRRPRSSTRATRSCSTTRAATSARRPWHESDLVQRLPGGRAWYVVDARALRQPCESERWPTWSRPRGPREATSGRRRSFRSRCRQSPKLVEPPFLAVRVHAAVTHTIGGLRIDDRARVLDADGRRSPACWPRAPTRAASSPAATAAASPPRSSSAASPPRRRSLTALWDVSGSDPVVSAGRALHSPAACRLRPPIGTCRGQDPTCPSRTCRSRRAACRRSGGGRRAAATGRAC